ncbi:NAD-dependent epimerase/dehydratase family protein [Litorisediminicola beolgyonensis]|uniref:NAD-dependent epimerase/dehydratase family protein n=1 Tax=Litorisediminicola beolgyonensis TaxID=1173614 RepID=A0ABW3ZFY8_9RHOB
MRVALTGAGGIVGGFIARALLRASHKVLPLGRPGWTLGGPDPDLTGVEALVHCAFDHAPGRYRGGDRGDPVRFRALNLDGSSALFDAAERQGVTRIVFLSSRAVFDGYPPGTVLAEDLAPCPTESYGRIKAEAEARLARLSLSSASLRATGVYGPGHANKWRGLFTEYLAGRPIQPRLASEVHGEDLAAAVLLLLENPQITGAVHCSDILLDRHDLLSDVRMLTDCPHPPPSRAARAPNVLDCSRLRALGWRPGGEALLRASLPILLRDL